VETAPDGERGESRKRFRIDNGSIAVPLVSQPTTTQQLYANPTSLPCGRYQKSKESQLETKTSSP